MNECLYDVIIIGTGAGGGTLARILSPSGKKILVLERGPFLPKEKANWDSNEIIEKERYKTSEVWFNRNGQPIKPYTYYFVGGNTKFYGSSLYRFREQDFEKVVHKGGISPEWPLKYRDFSSYYDRAEQLYDVHGQQGLDPTEPPRSNGYPFPPVSHEPYMQGIYNLLKNRGWHPFYQPLGLKLDEANRHNSACIRCNTCDSFPCQIDAKADADVNGVRPATIYPNVTLITEAKALRLHTNSTGRQVTGVEAEVSGQRRIFSGHIVVISCGAVNSAILLLKSANECHPNGLANSSDLVGRNYMGHKFAAISALSIKPHSTVYPKTIAVNDFYWGEEFFPYPMGNVQSLGTVNADMAAANGSPFFPRRFYEAIANRIIAWLLITEDLPDLNNRVRLKGDKIILDYTPNNEEAFKRLIKRWIQILKSIDPFSLYITSIVPLSSVTHQCGTCRFGEDPENSVLNPDCRAHDVENLYVVDGSFFPSSSALNPSLTIMANAIRVGEHLLERLK